MLHGQNQREHFLCADASATDLWISLSECWFIARATAPLLELYNFVSTQTTKAAAAVHPATPVLLYWNLAGWNLDNRKLDRSNLSSYAFRRLPPLCWCPTKSLTSNYKLHLSCHACERTHHNSVISWGISHSTFSSDLWSQISGMVSSTSVVVRPA